LQDALIPASGLTYLGPTAHPAIGRARVVTTSMPTHDRTSIRRAVQLAARAPCIDKVSHSARPFAASITCPGRRARWDSVPVRDVIRVKNALDPGGAEL